MVRRLVAAGIEAEMKRGGEHAGMLARAVVVDRAGTPSAAQQLARRRLAQRPMRAASQFALRESRLAEQTPDRIEMDAVAAMGRAGDRKLLGVEIEHIGRAALHQRQRLQDLHGRARIDGSRHIAEREQALALRIGDGDGATVTALDETAPEDVDEHRVLRCGTP